MSRVGMFGQGSGATIAILASAVDPWIRVLDILDPWGDWPNWIATSPFVPEEERSAYMKAEFLKNAALLDPVAWLPKVRASKLHFQQNMFELDTPPAVKEKLRAVAPRPTQFVLYKTLHGLDETGVSVASGKSLDGLKRSLLGSTGLSQHS